MSHYIGQRDERKEVLHPKCELAEEWHSVKGVQSVLVLSRSVRETLRVAVSLGTLHEILSEYSSNDRSEDTCNRIRNADRHSGGIVLCRAACGRRAARVIVNMKKIIKITKNLRRRGRARGLARATFL